MIGLRRSNSNKRRRAVGRREAAMTSPQDLIINLIKYGHDDERIAQLTGITVRTVRQIRRDAASDGEVTTVLPLPIVPVGSDDWTQQAVCPQTDYELFYPEKGGSTTTAKKICRVCPVKAECLEVALANGERHGVWGGMSDRERRALVARRGGRTRRAS